MWEGSSLAMAIHFSGIAGKGIAPAAGVALSAGYKVTGHDLIENHRIPVLRQAGAEISLGRNVDPPSGTTLHVRSSLVTTQRTGVIERSRLGFVSDILRAGENHVLAVAGSVGKSSAAAVIWAAHRSTSPGCYIGADLPETLCGGRYSKRTTAIVEADEYKDAYRALLPNTVALLNVFPNHEDHFGKGTSGFSKSFASWTGDIPLTASEVVMTADAAAQLAANGVRVPATVLSVDTPWMDDSKSWQIEIVSASPGGTLFRLRQGRKYDDFEIPLAGAHIATAAAIGVITARAAGIRDNEIRDGIAASTLPLRRQSLVHHARNVWVYDDNARLPVQFTTTVAALRQAHPAAQVIAVISPWGRLNRRNVEEWAQAGTHADTLVVLPVGEAAVSRGGAELDDADNQLVMAVRQRGTRALAITKWEALPDARGETVYVTAGYDAQYEMFSGAHGYLQRRYNWGKN